MGFDDDDIMRRGRITVEFEFSPELQWRIKSIIVFMKFISYMVGWAIDSDLYYEDGKIEYIEENEE